MDYKTILLESKTILDEKYEFTIETKGLQSCSGFYYETHSHPNIELFFCRKGRFRVICDSEITLEEGDMVLIPPMAVHGFDCEGEVSFGYFLFDEDIYGDAENVWIFKTCDRLCHIRAAENAAEAERLNGLIDTVLGLYSEGDGALITEYSRILLILLIRLALSKNGFSASDKDNRSKINRILMYIQTHYSEPCTLDDIAGYLSVNRYYVSKLINENFGCSLCEMRNKYRLYEAVHMLTQTDDSLLNISESVGYSSLSAFNRSFIRKYSMSAGRYRKLARKKDLMADQHI